MPDLAFSELTFLNPHRENSAGLAKSSDNRSRPKRGNAGDSGANVSSYFTSMNSINHDEPFPDQRPSIGLSHSSGERKHQRYDDRRLKSQDRHPSLPLVELPQKPFLGFGSSGIEMTSPALASRNIGATVDPPRRKLSSTQSTGYVSWSVSGAPSHHSPQLYHSDKTSTRSPIHIERPRALTNDVPIVISENQDHDRGSEQVSIKNDTSQECPRPVPTSRNRITETNFTDRSIQLAHQPISDSIKRHSTPKNAPNDSHSSPMESTVQQSQSNNKLKAAFIDEEQVGLPHLPESDSPGGISQEDSSILLDTELDKFLQKFKSKQTQSVHDSACQTSTYCAQSEPPSVVHHDNSTNLRKATDRLPTSENKYINTDVNDLHSGHDSTNPSQIPSTQAEKIQIDPTVRTPGIEPLGPARRGSLRSAQNGRRLENTEDRSEYTAKSKTDDGFTRNAWSGYNNIYQQQTGIGIHNSRSDQDCAKMGKTVDFEGPENSSTFHDVVNDTPDVPDGHNGYENIESFDSNRNMVGSGYHGHSTYDESTISAPHNIDELFYQSNLTSGTELDAPLYRDELLRCNGIPPGDLSELEHGYTYLRNHDLGTSALPSNSDRHKNEANEKCWLRDRQQLNIRPQLRAQNATLDLGGNMRMASFQQNEDGLPGFWRPHKRY